MTSNRGDPPIYRLWNLSTSHITLRDAKLLSDSRCLVVYEHEYGWLVLVPQDDVGEAMTEVAEYGHSEALQTLLRLAHERDIRMIRFDCDGDLVAGLETFGW
jgi:hypothetical protein